MLANSVNIELNTRARTVDTCTYFSSCIASLFFFTSSCTCIPSPYNLSNPTFPVPHLPNPRPRSFLFIKTHFSVPLEIPMPVYLREDQRFRDRTGRFAKNRKLRVLILASLQSRRAGTSNSGACMEINGSLATSQAVINCPENFLLSIAA